ncbi:MAG: hypothetical protein V8T86_08465 [Victivallis sp.]
MDELKRWNANLIRWQIKRNWGRAGTELDLEEYLRWFNGRLEELDKVLDKCGELGIYVLIDLHTPPGGRDETGNMVMFYNPVYRDAFCDVGADGEAVQGPPRRLGLQSSQRAGPDPADGRRLSERAVRSCQTHPGDRPGTAGHHRVEQLQQPGRVSGAAAAAAGEHHLPGAHVCPVLVHAPGNLRPPGGTRRLPGVIEGAPYDRERLKRCLAPVREFEKKYGAKIYIGEFSAVRYAPGAAQYLEELISIFEEYGWDWSYHAFRESPYWDVELDAEAKPAETDRRKVLLKYFRRNR